MSKEQLSHIGDGMDLLTNTPKNVIPKPGEAVPGIELFFVGMLLQEPSTIRYLTFILRTLPAMTGREQEV